MVYRESEACLLGALHSNVFFTVEQFINNFVINAIYIKNFIYKLRTFGILKTNLAYFSEVFYTNTLLKKRTFLSFHSMKCNGNKNREGKKG